MATVEQLDTERSDKLEAIMRTATASVKEGRDPIDVLTYALCAAYNAGWQRATPVATSERCVGEECPNFTLPASFTFNPDNEEEQAEIARRLAEHQRKCEFPAAPVGEGERRQ